MDAIKKRKETAKPTPLIKEAKIKVREQPEAEEEPTEEAEQETEETENILEEQEETPQMPTVQPIKKEKVDIGAMLSAIIQDIDSILSEGLADIKVIRNRLENAEESEQRSDFFTVVVKSVKAVVLYRSRMKQMRKTLLEIKAKVDSATKMPKDELAELKNQINAELDEEDE